MKIRYLFITLMLSFCVFTQAQNNANQLMTQAQTSLEQNDFTKARYLFIQAFESLSNSGQVKQAVEAGTQATFLYYRENYYQEAFALCRKMNEIIFLEEQRLQKSLFEERFMVTKERLEMYIRLKNAAQAQLQLNNLEKLANQANLENLSNELLYTQASFYYTFGQNEKGDEAFQAMAAKYQEKKEFDKVSDCYRNLISIASKANNAKLMERTYEKFMVWNDKVKALTAQDKLGALQSKFDQSLQTIQEKDDTISTKQYVIVALITLVVILIVGLVFLGFLLLRFIMGNRKLKNIIETTNEHNEQQSQFIQNIATQMEPTLEALKLSACNLRSAAPDQSASIINRVDSLKNFALHIQELSALENSLMEPYDVTSFNIGKFCEKMLAQVKDLVQPEVELKLDVPSSEVKTNAEHLEEIVLHLLKNAAAYTTSGHIRLEFKRKGAHLCQLVLTDTGCGIPLEQRDSVFKPFNEAKDLAAGDGLGLPICALKATKLNGALSLDKEYKKGCRFILVLHI